MAKQLLLCLFVVMTFSFANASDVSELQARKVAVNFMSERLLGSTALPDEGLKISDAISIKENNKVLYYIFHFTSGGWIAVSGVDVVKPVLSYSFEGTCKSDQQPPQFKAWMKQYADQISYAVNNAITADSKIMAEWEQLSREDLKKLSPFKDREVQPLIDSKWNQNSPYNGECPADPLGPGGHAYAGCVPTCMGQIMYYYRWPDKGVGSYTYIDNTYGVQHVSFDSTWYEWENMKNSLMKSNHGVAELLYHLGVSCDLVYGANGSGMYNHKAAYSLRTYFKYSPETQYIFRDSTNLNWDSVIIAHLDRKMPLYYAGWSVPNINGHAFVCDGYQGTDYFHFNFGWSGSSDGYFYIDNLTPGGNNFNLAQELIINIYPDTTHYTYPQRCNGIKTLHYIDGSITDGSGPMHNYNSGANCQWLIDPQTDKDSISSITLSFTNFELSGGDQLKVYDGSTINAPLLGSFSGNTLPPEVTSTNNKVLVTFETTSPTTSSGWYADYSTKSPVWCSGTTIINGDTAEFTDGSFRFDYHNNTNCKWKLLSNDTLPMTIYFRYFDTEANRDALKVYDLDQQVLLATISGTYDSANPPAPLTSSKGKFLLLFNSNGSITGQGFEIYYPKSTLGITSSPIKGLKIFPNPTKENICVKLHNDKQQVIKVELLDLNGMQLFSNEKALQIGENQLYINLFDYTPGMYLLRITTQDSSVITKVIKE